MTVCSCGARFRMVLAQGYAYEEWHSRVVHAQPTEIIGSDTVIAQRYWTLCKRSSVAWLRASGSIGVSPLARDVTGGMSAPNEQMP